MSLDEVRAPNGRFRVLAIDHRDSMRAFLQPDDPGAVPPPHITELKIDVVRVVSPLATAVMLDPEYSIPEVIESGAVAPHVGVIAALEAQGYLADPVNTVTEILPGWSVPQAVASGAAMCKLLLPYHPDRPTAPEQEQVTAEVAEACHEADVPLVVEPVAFALEDPASHTDVVVRSVVRLQRLGMQVLKIPFPGRADDRSGWAGACASVADVAELPWVILSGGGGFDAFAAQLTVAIDHGCAGFMVGRALWGEAARASDRAERLRLLEDLVRPRFAHLCELAP